MEFVKEQVYNIQFLNEKSLTSLAAGYNVAFIHPKSAVGVLVELVQATPEVIAANKK